MRRHSTSIVASVILWNALLLGCKVMPPGKRETQALQWTKRHLTVSYKDVKNPLKSSAELCRRVSRPLALTASYATGWIGRTPAFHFPIVCHLRLLG
jgi:hypothetical protein